MATCDPPTAGLLPPEQAEQILRRHGIPTPPQRRADGVEEVVAAAEAIGYPVALKGVAPTLVHKSDAGAVRLAIGSAEQLRHEAEDIRRSAGALEGFLVQAMAQPGQELIVGARRDPVFGPLVLVGRGGVLAELLEDSAVARAPVTPARAAALLGSLRTAPLLEGYRGATGVDQDALRDLVVAVGALVAHEQDVLELDLNPVIAGPAGVVAVDARILRGDVEGPPRSRPPGGAAVRSLLSPRSIAVVGASRDTRKQGGRLFHYLTKHGYSGPLYPVNPRATEVGGVPAHPSLAALPEVPDLACIVLPAPAVPEAIRECGRRGIGAAVVYTAGFSEAGEDGAALAAELDEAIAESGVRVCGPNTAGVVDVPGSMAATIGMAFTVEEMPAGSIAFVTQSGALGSSLLSRSWTQGVGFSRWICAGNEADLTLSDFVLELADDPATRVISIFMEALRDPVRFEEACRLARARGKPVVVYKTGYSEVGRRAVQSHTAALAGDGAVYDAVLAELGVVQVRDLQSLVDASQALAWQPAAQGRRVAVVSASGGACSVVADACAAEGLEIPTFSPTLRRRVEDRIPSFGEARNPVDVTMEITTRPEMVGGIVADVAASEEIDAVLVVLTTNADPPAIQVARGVVDAASTSSKPVIVTRVGADFLAPESMRMYREAQLPVFPMPDRAVRAARALAEFGATGGP